MRIPFNDLVAHHAPIREELLDAVAAVIDSGEFAGGSFVEAFENQFAAYCGTRHAIGVATGTDALGLTLRAMGIGPGDEVITVPMSFIATAEAISLTGASPVFVDIDPRTYTMNPLALENALTPRTKAIIPVHLFGQPADMGPILRFARTHGLRVIEDAAQGHGAEYHGQKAGSLADAGCFSFYPGKNLGALGEGGAVVTGDDLLAEKIRVLRDHGQTRKYRHAVIGWNSRMDAIQAAVLGIKLRRLDESNRARRSHAARYRHFLAGNEAIVLPETGEDRTHVFHVFAVRVADRDRVARHLDSSGIGCGIHYPVPVHLQPAYQNLSLAAGTYPVSETCADSFLSLPIYPELTPAQTAEVAAVLMEAVSQPLKVASARPRRNPAFSSSSSYRKFDAKI